VFFDDIPESIKAATFIRYQLPPEFRNKIKWFNSDMSNEFKDEEGRSFSCGDVWGLFTTDSFGMVRRHLKIRFVIDETTTYREWTYRM
jgi:hypothetical protein